MMLFIYIKLNKIVRAFQQFVDLHSGLKTPQKNHHNIVHPHYSRHYPPSTFQRKIQDKTFHSATFNIIDFPYAIKIKTHN